MRVEPQELRGAATVVDGIVGDIKGLPGFGSGSGVLGSLGSFMQGSATGPELDRIEPARAKAIRVVTGRYLEFAGLLRTSADNYRDTDLAAATRLSALGDLNAGVR